MNPFDYLNSKNLTVTETKKEFGKTGLWEICAVITEAMNQAIEILDVDMVSNFAGVKKDRAAKILSNAQIILMEYRDNLKEISRKSQDNVEKISRKSEDFTPSNPHGSTQAHARAVEDDEEVVSSSPQPPKQESPEFKKFMSVYPKPFNRKDAWAEWYFQGLDSSLDEIMSGLESYLTSEDWKKENGKFIPNPLKFLEEERWTFAPGQRLKVVAYKPTHVDRLMAAKRIRSVVDKTLFYDTSELERDTFNQIYPKSGGPRLIESEFEPVEEEFEKHA